MLKNHEYLVQISLINEKGDLLPPSLDKTSEILISHKARTAFLELYHHNNNAIDYIPYVLLNGLTKDPITNKYKHRKSLYSFVEFLSKNIPFSKMNFSFEKYRDIQQKYLLKQDTKIKNILTPNRAFKNILTDTVFLTHYNQKISLLESLNLIFLLKILSPYLKVVEPELFNKKLASHISKELLLKNSSFISTNYLDKFSNDRVLFSKISLINEFQNNKDYILKDITDKIKTNSLYSHNIASHFYRNKENYIDSLHQMLNKIIYRYNLQDTLSDLFDTHYQIFSQNDSLKFIPSHFSNDFSRREIINNFFSKNPLSETFKTTYSQSFISFISNMIVCNHPSVDDLIKKNIFTSEMLQFIIQKNIDDIEENKYFINDSYVFSTINTSLLDLKFDYLENFFFNINALSLKYPSVFKNLQTNTCFDINLDDPHTSSVDSSKYLFRTPSYIDFIKKTFPQNIKNLEGTPQNILKTYSQFNFLDDCLKQLNSRECSSYKDLDDLFYNYNFITKDFVKKIEQKGYINNSTYSTYLNKELNTYEKTEKLFLKQCLLSEENLRLSFIICQFLENKHYEKFKNYSKQEIIDYASQCDNENTYLFTKKSKNGEQSELTPMLQKIIREELLKSKLEQINVSNKPTNKKLKI